MKKTSHTRIALRLALLFAVLLAVALVRVTKSIDVDDYRVRAIAWTRQATGRDLAFTGPVKLKLSLHPALTANGVTLANRAGGARGQMVRLDHVEAQIGLLPLLRGEVRIDRVLVDGADILLEQDGQGRGNWEFAPASGEPVPGVDADVRVTQLVFRRVAVHLQNPADDSLAIERATFETDSLSSPIALTLDGSWNGKHLAVSGLLGSLKEVFVDEKPLSLRLKALMPGLVASAEGTVRSARQGLDLALSMTADLNDSADLDPLIGLPLPSLGSARAAFVLSGSLSRPSLSTVEATVGRHDTLAITVKGRVADPLAGTGIDLALSIDGDASASFGFGTPGKPLPMALSGHVGASGDGDGKSWRIADLKGTLGHSDLAGKLDVSRHAGHSVIEGQFDSALLDLTRPPQPAPQSANETARVLPVDGRLFADDPLPTQILMSSDGHLVWRVARLVDRKMSAGAVTLDLDWREGKLTAQGGAAQIGGGRIDGSVSLDARTTPPAAAVDLSVAHVELGALLAQLGLSDGLQGAKIDLKLKSAGTGASVRGLVATLQGTSLLSVGPTQVATRFVDDGFGAIFGRLGGGAGPWIDMRCLISQFTLADGLARSEALLFAVGNQTVTGQGSINLGSEGLDFTLTPRPAGQTPAVQVDLGGTLLHPSVAPARAAYVKNMPGVVGDAASPLMSFASDGNPCFAALAQGRKAARPVAGGLR